MVAIAKPKNGRSSSFLQSIFFVIVGAVAMHLWRGPASTCPEIKVTAPREQKLTSPLLKVKATAAQNVVDPKATVDAERDEERDFYSIGMKTSTDKVAALARLEGCLNDETDKTVYNPSCPRPGCQRVKCIPWGHYYQTIYQSRMGKYSKMSAEPFQFLEIGFFNGAGADTYREFFPRAEVHSLEIACLPEGPAAEGKWPWGNFAAKHKDYETLRQTNRLHCGDASDVTFLDKVWNTHMKRPDAPPLTIVVDDGSHLAAHMAQSVFYWFPKIQPGGLMVVEDVQPIMEANWFRTRFLPKMMSDLHFCGDPKQPNDTIHFPTIQPLLASIHCEMHICVFGRNDEPAVELSLELSTTPADSWNDQILLNSWGGPKGY
jgi:hypothetical protein